MIRRGETTIAVVLSLLLAAGAGRGQASSDKAESLPKNAVVEQLHIVYRFQNDGTGEIIDTSRIRILTELGLKMYGAVYVPYSSEMESLKIDYLRTIKAGGSSIPADASKAIDITPPVTRAAPMFSDVKMKVLVAPQVQVGDAIEFQYTRTIRTPYMPGNFWVTYSLLRMNPIDSGTVVLDVPAGRQLSFESDPCFHYTKAEEGGRTTYTWQISNLQPPKDLFAPRPPLFAASTLNSWKQVADWYTNLQSQTSPADPAIAALAAKLTAGKTAPEQKLDAIYAYVSERIRYVALEFGIGGFKAHAAPVVLNNGYGDCKDKSGLLAALLNAAGIKAYPALVNAATGVLDEGAPMPSQFNHVMTVALLNGKPIWLDSTMETAPPGVLSPLVLGKQALLAEPGVDRLVPVPLSPPAFEPSIASASGNINSSGALTLAGNVQFEGLGGALMRRLFRLQDKNQLNKAMKAMARYEVPGATVSKSSSSDPNDLAGAFKFQLTLTKDSFLDLLEKNEAIPLPRLIITPNQWAAALERAKEDKKDQSTSGCASGQRNDIKLYGPLETKETLDLAIPAGYQVELPEPIQVTRPYGSYTSAYSFAGGHVVVHRDLNVKVLQIPLAEMQSLQNFQDLINDDLGQSLTLRRTGEANILSGAESMTADELDAAGVEALQKHGDPILARDLLLKAVAKDPKSQTAWNNLGRAYAAIGNFYQARKALEKQIAINSYDPYAYDNLGRVEMAQQHYHRAVTNFKQQLSVSPLSLDASTALAGAYDALRDWSDAAAAGATAVRLNPRNALLYATWGSDLLKAGQNQQGSAQLAQALEISKAPAILNNVSYAKAEAGLDLAAAEAEARSAIDQALPESVSSLDVPASYRTQLFSISAFLDTLGWVLYKENRLAEARADLTAAFEIAAQPDTAQHLAMVAMKQNDPSAALRYYLISVAIVGKDPIHTPKELKDFIASHGVVPEMTAARTAAIHEEAQEFYRLGPPAGGALTWPGPAAKTVSSVILNLLVGENGKVVDTKVFKGSEPYASAALRDARNAVLPPLRWPGHSLETVRTAIFLYNPDAAGTAEKVRAFWRYGDTRSPQDSSRQAVFDFSTTAAAAAAFMTRGQTEAGVDLLDAAVAQSKNLPEDYGVIMLMSEPLRYQGELQGAAAMQRVAARIQPTDDFAYRKLAETLTAMGDRAGAIQAYQQLLKLDPEDAASHFNLGSDYEKQAATPAFGSGAERGKVKKQKKGKKNKANEPTLLQRALQQYSQAAKLAPDNAAYHAAYARLYEEVHHTPPPAAVKAGSIIWCREPVVTRRTQASLTP
ncbi:MAG: DUF3857 domain-containing protein [Acidobacteriota bacterium]|nr:DUF3857 domain-containing protein [Acidobacteriota bacterium]